jgi:antitoxin component of MazEF toxin-antitoxin module
MDRPNEATSPRYESRLQVINRKKDGNQQYYIICPVPLAKALEFKKGETLTWMLEDQYTIRLQRTKAPPEQRLRELLDEAVKETKKLRRGTARTAIKRQIKETLGNVKKSIARLNM